MASLSDHPTVQAFRARNSTPADSTPSFPLDAAWLRTLCLEAGADDVGMVEIDRAEIADQRADILAVFPHTKTLISLVGRMNRENVRSPARSVANVEFHHAGNEIEEVARSVVTVLEQKGIRAINPAMSFPQEMQHYPGKIWVVAHKPVAVAAGLGQIGIHRNVIHPKFGNFILLATILLDAEVSAYDKPISYNPCLECKLCVSACPVGAIGADGHFNFSACYTHNYREFMGGFMDWVEKVVDSKNATDYYSKVSPAESASMWQSLSFKANYKAAYCMAVCPAGEDVIGPFLTNRKEFLDDVVRPLQNKEEIIYVAAGSDAEAHVARRFPHKTVKHVGAGPFVSSIRSFLSGMSLVFQREQSAGLDVTYHFTFTGKEACKATVIIRDKTLQVEDGHVGTANLLITADSQTWIGFLARQKNIAWALAQRKIRVKGPLSLFRAFGRCFLATP